MGLTRARPGSRAMNIPRATRAIVAASIVGGALTIFVAVWRQSAPGDIDQGQWIAAAAIGGLALGSWVWPVVVYRGGESEALNMDEGFLVILALLVPPLVTLGTLGLVTILAQAIRRRPLVKSAFNAGQVLIAAGLGLAVTAGRTCGTWTGYLDACHPCCPGPLVLGGGPVGLGRGATGGRGMRRGANAGGQAGRARADPGPAAVHGQRGELRQAYREGQEDQFGVLGLALNAAVLRNTGSPAPPSQRRGPAATRSPARTPPGCPRSAISTSTFIWTRCRTVMGLDQRFPEPTDSRGCWRSSERDLPAGGNQELPGDGQLGHGLLLDAGRGRSRSVLRATAGPGLGRWFCPGGLVMLRRLTRHPA